MKWDERTRLTGPRRAKDVKKDFSAFEHGNIVNQIDKVCLLSAVQFENTKYYRL